MQQPVKPVPDGYHTVTPYLIVEGAARLIAFAEHAFGATTVVRMQRPDGTLGHSEVQIGDARVMLAEATAQWPPMPGALFLYVEDVDAVYRRALEAGARSVMAPADTYHGDRMGGVFDPCGNQWWIATQIEALTPAELARREAEHWKEAPAR